MLILKLITKRSARVLVGAFGGNKVLMALLQMAAAHMAGVDELVYHLASSGGDAYNKAKSILRELIFTNGEESECENSDDSVMSTDLFVDAIVSKGFRWGVSNGT